MSEAAATPAPPTEGRNPLLPPPITATLEVKAVVIDGIKKMMQVFQSNGLMPGGFDYDEMMNDPAALEAFINAYKQNPSLAEDVVKDGSGKPIPLDKPETLTQCGISMKEVERLLVLTCAKRVYSVLDQEDTDDDATKRFLFFFKKKKKKKSDGPGRGTRRFMTVKHLIGHDWQLPLLETYRDHLTQAHVLSLADDILHIRSFESMIAATQFEAETIRKAKGIMGKEFVEVLKHKPAALSGIVSWGPDRYQTFKKLLGPHIWTFYTRDQHDFNAIASLDAPRLRALGPLLATVDAENLKELNRLDAGKFQAVVQAMKDVFGDQLIDIMGHSGLASKVLRRLVDGFLHMQVDDDTFRETAKVSVQAVHDDVINHFTG